MAESDPEQLAKRLEEEAQAMQARSTRLGEEASQAREDWETKRADPSVPGAPQPDADSDDQAQSSPAADQGDG